MAVNWNANADVQRTAHGYSILPEKVLVPDGLSGRYEATSIDELAEDIKAKGQVQLAVCWKNEHGWPVLAAGNRRRLAISKANTNRRGDNKIRLEFTYIDAKNEEEAFDYTISENNNRVNPSEMDNAYNMHIYQTRFKLGYEGIAKKYFPSAKGEDLKKAIDYVKKTMRLLNLTDDLKAEVEAGTIQTSVAQQLASVPSRATMEKVADLARKKTAAKGKKGIQVEAVKEAKVELGVSTVRVPISENSPAKQLEKCKAVLGIASSLAFEVLAYCHKIHNKHGDKDIMLEYAQQVAVACKKLKISQEPELAHWAEDNQTIPTILDGEAA